MRKGFPVIHSFRFLFIDLTPLLSVPYSLPLLAVLPDSPVFRVKGFPTIMYSQLISDMSYWTRNLSLISLAAGKAFLTVRIIAEDKSVVTVLTVNHFLCGSLHRIALTIASKDLVSSFGNR